MIISPSKTIKQKDNYFLNITEPIFIEKTAGLLKYIQALDYDECKELWKCNDKLATLNFERFQNMKLDENIVPAIFAYEGLQYTYICAHTLDNNAISYIEKKLCILSGFYGILKPSTGICPYRLEMLSNINYMGFSNLYDYWSDDLADYLEKNSDGLILNLASKEYSKAIFKYQKQKKLRIITINFCENYNGKLKQKASFAKMARGEFVREMAINNIEKLEDIKKLKILDYKFSKENSNDEELIFIKEK